MGRLVFAGQRLPAELRSLGQELGISERVVEVEGTENDLLEALYSSALALLIPFALRSFGWPIIEPKACGCPVICAAREPMSEVGGDAALTAELEKTAMARASSAFSIPRNARAGCERLQNVERFTAENMIAQYITLYRSLGGAGLDCNHVRDRGSLQFQCPGDARSILPCSPNRGPDAQGE
jgi:glycosyltransferase involved in cell wall biosynthesis